MRKIEHEFLRSNPVFHHIPGKDGMPTLGGYPLTQHEVFGQEILQALQIEFKEFNQDILASDLDVFIQGLVTNGFLRLEVS